MNTQDYARRAADNPSAFEAGQRDLQQLLQRSATDVEFRQLLLSDPRAALAASAGVDVSVIPESLNVKFVENTADATIVLPDLIDPEAELSERELEAVAGGVIPILITIAAVVGGAALGYGAYTAGHDSTSCHNR